MRHVGVDPGATGALALFEGSRLLEVEDMPTVVVRRGKTDKAEVDGHALADLLRRWQPTAGYVELVGGMTGQSASAAFNFGRAAGAVEYGLVLFGAKVRRIAPATWRRGLKVNVGKDGSRAMATTLWPTFAQQFRRKKDDGRAEAALIGYFGHQQDERQHGAVRHDDIFA